MNSTQFAVKLAAEINTSKLPPSLKPGGAAPSPGGAKPPQPPINYNAPSGTPMVGNPNAAGTHGVPTPQQQQQASQIRYKAPSGTPMVGNPGAAGTHGVPTPASAAPGGSPAAPSSAGPRRPEGGGAPPAPPGDLPSTPDVSFPGQDAAAPGEPPGGQEGGGTPPPPEETGGGPGDGPGWGNAFQQLLGGNLSGAWNQTPEYGKWGMGIGGGLLLLMLLSRMFGKQGSYSPGQIKQARDQLAQMQQKQAMMLAPRYSRMGRGAKPDGKFVPGHRFQGSQQKPRVRQTGAAQHIEEAMGDKTASVGVKLASGPLLLQEGTRRRIRRDMQRQAT